MIPIGFWEWMLQSPKKGLPEALGWVLLPISAGFKGLDKHWTSGLVVIPHRRSALSAARFWMNCFVFKEHCLYTLGRTSAFLSPAVRAALSLAGKYDLGTEADFLGSLGIGWDIDSWIHRPLKSKWRTEADMWTGSHRAWYRSQGPWP